MNTHQWRIMETDADLALMSRVLAVSEITANVMANRGIRTKKKALSYLNPQLRDLYDPLLMEDMEPALALISDTIAKNGKITLYGDYDVDGVMATVILYKTLRKLDANVDYYIPHRSGEGYGLHIDAVRNIGVLGTDLIITVDNGIASAEEIREANALGMRVLVIDHHEPGFAMEGGRRGDVLPEAAAVIDPRRQDCVYPFKHLCAAGLSYKVAGALFARLGLPFTGHDELLTLAAIATLCDIVDLNDENRVIVKCGLGILNNNKLINPGLGSLITRRGYLDKPVDEFTVGYVLGPCINATGRLDNASLSVRLLLEQEEKERFRLAERLTELNEERKKLTGDCVSRALEAVKGNTDKIIVLTDNQAHESIAGIAAGRVRDAVNRPAILLTQGDASMKGSGRSIEGYNLFEALYAHRHLFLRFGGHAMAAGLSLMEENIPLLREALNADCVLSENDFIPVFEIDRVIRLDDINLSLARELECMAPFGKGNREPVFAAYNLFTDNMRIIDEKNTLIFSFRSEGGRRVKGIAFGLNELFNKALQIFGEEEQKRVRGGSMGLVMDAVFSVEINVYNNNESVQMRIKDIKIKNNV